MNVLYDAGALVAADRNSSKIWHEHRRLLERDVEPVTTAPVVAQVSRSPRQANLRRFLNGCKIVAFADADGHEIGSLLARSGTSDVIDAHVVRQAAAREATVWTSDVDDIEWLAEAAGVTIDVRQV